MNFLKNLFSKKMPEKTILGKTRVELQNFFSDPLEDKASEQVYPAYFKFNWFPLNAYAVDFLIQNSQINLVIQTLEKHGITNIRLGEVFTQNNQDNKTIGKIFELFAGQRVEILTTDHSLLIDLQHLNLSPPPPWIALPDTEYRADWWGGNSQGDTQFYKENYFDTFFNPLNIERKTNYLKKVNATPEWSKALINWAEDDFPEINH